MTYSHKAILNDREYRYNFDASRGSDLAKVREAQYTDGHGRWFDVISWNTRELLSLQHQRRQRMLAQTGAIW